MVIVEVIRYESKKQSDEERYLWGANFKPKPTDKEEMT